MRGLDWGRARVWSFTWLAKWTVRLTRLSVSPAPCVIVMLIWREREGGDVCFTSTKHTSARFVSRSACLVLRRDRVGDKV